MLACIKRWLRPDSYGLQMSKATYRDGQRGIKAYSPVHQLGTSARGLSACHMSSLLTQGSCPGLNLANMPSDRSVIFVALTHGREYCAFLRVPGRQSIK